MELWGGIECTVNRVGDRYRDQTILTGHHDRPDDLRLIADLGVRKLRYPVLWERVEAGRSGEWDWRWTDERLATIRQLGIAPIVGLLHHGSGPRDTSLIADDFVERFAAFAGATAARYPWLERWTPINEPLTTARFSTLYGIWYPHARDEGLFWLALLNQVDATRAAMRAIRAVNSAATLIQTEDLGQVHATPEVAEAAAHLNHRRWMTWDLLCGRVTPGHSLWDRLAEYGLADRARAIADDPCPPDVIGINYYPTSDRFLDHRHGLYPSPADTPYRDLVAYRVLDPSPAGLQELLCQTWDRYGIAIAVTECHLGCTRDEQLRWLVESWQACARAAKDGVRIEALTAWALFGNVDWTQLLAVETGHHEPGVFDVRNGEPRPTALAAMIKRLAADSDAPAMTANGASLGGAGWWRRPIRLLHPPFVHNGPAFDSEPPAGPPLLITGASGVLGQAFTGAARLRDLPFVLAGREMLDVTDPAAVARVLDLYRPWAVIDAASWAEAEYDFAAPRDSVLAGACAARGLQFVSFAFDRIVGPHELICSAPPAALLVLTGTFFSPYDDNNFARVVERRLRAGQAIVEPDEQLITPTYVPDLVNACLDLAIDGEGGTWHLTSGESMTRLAFGRVVARSLGLDPALVVAADGAELGGGARGRKALPSKPVATLLPPFADALERFAAVRAVAHPRSSVPELAMSNADR